MQDEVPDRQPQDAGEGAAGDAVSDWWPWPEAQDAQGTPHRDGAPGSDETLSFPLQEHVDAAPPMSEPASAEPTPVHKAPIDAPAAVVPSEDREFLAAPPLPSKGVENPDVPHDYVAPPVGVDQVGSIPAISAERAWAKGHLGNWRLHLVRLVSSGVAVVLAVLLVPGLSFNGWRWGEGLEIALIFGLLNVFVKPLLQFVSLRFLFSSYGIVIVAINTLLLVLLAWILDDSIESKSLLALLIGGALVGLIGGGLDSMLGANYPTLDRDYKERNGLT